MSRIYKSKDYKEPRVLRIRPEGWTQDLVFETGLGPMRCGQAEQGMGVRLGDKDGGGVLTNDDLMALWGAINNHFATLKEMTAQSEINN